MLNIKHLCKSFGQHTVLNDVNLTLQDGTLTAIIGPNGCGKSTLFNLITGELDPDSGQVLFNNQPINSLSPRKIARLGILRKFQIPGVFPNMSVAEHLNLARAISGASITRADLTELGKQMQLSDVLHTPAGILPTGQKQWLEMAMLVALKPKLLLLDEPISGMTHAEIEQTLHILHTLNQTGLSIITIEHNIHFVQQLTQDIAVLMNGHVYLRGSFETIAQDEQVKANYLGSLYV